MLDRTQAYACRLGCVFKAVLQIEIPNIGLCVLNVFAPVRVVLLVYSKAYRLTKK